MTTPAGPVTGFQPIGTMLAERQIVLFGADNRPILNTVAAVKAPRSSQIVTECQGCPTTYDPKFGRTLKREWVWTDEHEAAEFALWHMRDFGHDVKILHRHEFTFSLFEHGPVWSALFGPAAAAFVPDEWTQLARLGDCGDVERSYEPSDEAPGRHRFDERRCRRTNVLLRWTDRAGQEHGYEGSYWRRWLS